MSAGAGRIAAFAAAVVAVGGMIPPAPAAAGDGPAGRLVTRDGDRDAAMPERIDGAGAVWRRPDGARFEVPLAEIVHWRDCPPWPVGPVVLLADGGVVGGRIVAGDDRTVTIDGPLLGRIDLPPARVAGFRRSRAIGPGPLGTGTAVRRVMLANGDVVDAAAIDWRPGGVRLDTPEGDVTIPPETIDAIDFPSGDRGPDDAPRLLVALADGSRLAVAALLPGDSRERLALVIPAAAGPREVAIDRGDVVAIAVDGGAARLLASLPPVDYSHEPVVGPAWPLAVGRSLTGDWPAAGGVTGFTALGIHAAATVRYRPASPAARFSATVAIDDTTDGGGAAAVRVRARSGAGPWRDVIGPQIVRGGEPPRPIAADLAAADEIELVVDATAAGDVLGRTIWIDPRIVAER